MAHFSTMHRPVILSIEGNIGSGKSTLVQYLQTVLGTEVGNICFLEEPVDEWDEVKDEHGVTILENYYANQSAHAFLFQMMAYISRLNKIKTALQGDYDVIIMERSLETDRHVFAQMLRDSEQMTQMEFTVYMRWYGHFMSEIPEAHVVYLRTDPEVVAARVKKRARPGEDIPLSYLQQVSSSTMSDGIRVAIVGCLRFMADSPIFHSQFPGFLVEWLVIDGNMDCDLLGILVSDGTLGKWEGIDHCQRLLALQGVKKHHV